MLLLLLVLIPLLILLVLLRLSLPVAAPLALRLGVGPPVWESGSESEFEPRVTNFKEEGESESGGP